MNEKSLDVPILDNIIIKLLEIQVKCKIKKRSA